MEPGDGLAGVARLRVGLAGSSDNSRYRSTLLDEYRCEGGVALDADRHAPRWNDLHLVNSRRRVTDGFLGNQEEPCLSKIVCAAIVTGRDRN